jgi:maltooligosyltrehalose trehalohydrolase
MKRQHSMPFGAVPLDGEGVCFRLWAPGTAAVWVEIDGGHGYPMIAAGDGWFALTVPDAQVGSRYCFRLPQSVHGGLAVPDPASRYNPQDVHGPSQVIDPRAFDWTDEGWRGRPWEQAVIYEIHIGSFTHSGDFNGVIERLDYLVELGVTALELMPVADFPGRRNWGYDGVLPFAPDAAYGRPEDFKRLVCAAHQRGLMVLLDVVYNHFGPEGNYLHVYAPNFFNSEHTTPWGAAINFDGAGSRVVRDFFIHNALYWLEEYHLDGLRLDAIHAICDDTSPDVVEALSAAIRQGPGLQRHVHLVLENDRNQARYLNRDAGGRPCQATAQWNDDLHHALHVLVSGEADGYYAEFATEPIQLLGRCLTEGFAFQGDASKFRGGEKRGQPSAHLPPGAFVNFLQTHDQVGNRAFGERLCQLASPVALEAVTAILLLAPQTPLLFMGEEFAAAQPFLFFCDFGPELAGAVTQGRRQEFSRFARFTDPAEQARIPDPNAESSFTASVLDWGAVERAPHRAVFELHKRLLALRRQWLVPRLHGMENGSPLLELLAPRALAITWHLGDGSALSLRANLGEQEISPAVYMPAGQLLFATANVNEATLAAGRLPPWSVTWRLQERRRP